MLNIEEKLEEGRQLVSQYEAKKTEFQNTFKEFKILYDQLKPLQDKLHQQYEEFFNIGSKSDELHYDLRDKTDDEMLEKLGEIGNCSREFADDLLYSIELKYAHEFDTFVDWRSSTC